MSSEELADIPQPENLKTLTCGSKRPRQRVCELLNQQNLAPNGPLIELESDTDSTNNQHKTGKNNKKRNKSWIWSYFEQYEPTEQYRRIVKCLVQVQQKNGVESCSHFMGSDNSTGNFIVHLSTHRITEESHRRRMSEIRNNNQLSQTHNRPISICNDEGFVEFIHELDPNYQIPSDKTIQQLIAESYNQIKHEVEMDGYIGITYSFIDNNFNICEAILAVQYIPYSHTGDNIYENLENNDEYLQMIADVETQWNSSYLAWKRLIKIKDLIDVLASTMLIDPDASTRHFARATEYLGGNDNSDVEVIDLTSQNMAFDDDVGYKDAPEDEPISGQPIRRKININMPQNCINLDKRVKVALY
ncbi:unnamed protein product [Rhizophagus irregularis]|uniref:Uncharacterized protein n=1 Tax=Rhizophagus irregularis TaxID=588596 RepID=A0A915Z6M1_9GLOM|nr:unnamed protein product [Rhizophagus irregularis]